MYETEYKSIETIVEDYRNSFYRNKMAYPTARKYKVDHVFDEDKSVKWNKEEVERQNEFLENQKNVYNNESNRLSNLLEEDVITYLINAYEFNRGQAEKVWGYAYSEKHSVMIDVLNYVTELADFYEEMEKLK